MRRHKGGTARRLASQTLTCRSQPIGNSEFYAFDDRLAQILIRPLRCMVTERNLLPFDDFKQLRLVALRQHTPKPILAFLPTPPLRLAIARMLIEYHN